ncbi:GNAT family N-acetyltransferase [Nesterenkonia aurantiaca]|uniref:RimJ/RimL family protein N-acetyltransferase n=1 Tax=Nesterenkonia aurantiaca TaxID=1436010 RepID=A0A4R7G4W0_9MICC|nr:GNAT family N-acetyltransferase [Nesterenkonia aurantiaca]TDS86323.1 RimJ/RimL family protein N-acetyltransferase [Nesterenkonia aurantiaca]
MPDLTTDRLLLRDFISADVPGVHAYAADAEVCRYMDWGPNTLEQTRVFIEDTMAAASRSARESFTWAVTAGGEVLGACSVTITSAEHHRGELGYVLARRFWGQGYATEAADAVLGFAHEELGLQRVEATCRPGNIASQRVLRRIGMQQEALLRSHMLIRGRREDSLLFVRVD